MTAILRRPRCSNISPDVVPNPIPDIWSIVTILSAIVGGVFTAYKFLKALTVLTGATGGATAGLATAVALLVVIGWYLLDRCSPDDKGSSECVAGVVSNIVQDFNSLLDNLLPFTAMHDRIDLVVKSLFWDVVEDNLNYVHCTTEDIPRRSEIMRCYYFTARVCDAGRGAFIGAAVGAIPGIYLAALVAGVLCTTLWLCLLGLILAVFIVAAFVLAGAFAGGQIAKGEDTEPLDENGEVIDTGDLMTVKGKMLSRNFDDGANVFWWAESSIQSGNIKDTVENDPYSYCEVDDEFTMDGCEVPTIIL